MDGEGEGEGEGEGDDYPDMPKFTPFPNRNTVTCELHVRVMYIK